MKCWITSLLYSGPLQKKKELKEFDVIVNFRERTKTSHWYENELDAVFESLEIPHASVFKDTGRALKDKDITTKLLCRKIVDMLHDKRKVLLICRDGMSTCGFIAITCRAWYNNGGKKTTVAELVKEVRDNGDFTSAKAKDQRIQMDALLDYAREITNCPFIVKKSKSTN